MIEQLAEQARQASVILGSLSAQQKNQALARIAEALTAAQTAIVQANQADLADAHREQLSPALLKRLKFDDAKLHEAVAGINSLISLQDPVNRTLSATELSPGLDLYKVSCPIGVLGIVFEARPDALVQISSLALKSGNSVLLKGGREAANTNRVLADIITKAGLDAGLPQASLTLLETRSDVSAMLAMDEYIDLVIPRGSNAFVKYVMENTRIPVLGHADGICHVYVDGAADLDMAVRIAVDAKCQYPAVCNAMETLLVDKVIAEEFLLKIKSELETRGVELRGCETTRMIINVPVAAEDDWTTEYNDLILSIRVVDGLDAAISHINTFGSRHTDAIVTNDAKKAQRFLAQVDSANVFWNCSTRFADGFRYGLGAEVGISTGKIHARGPVGLEGLVTYKWKLLGRGQTVAETQNENAPGYTHRPLNTNCPL